MGSKKPLYKRAWRLFMTPFRARTYKPLILYILSLFFSKEKMCSIRFAMLSRTKKQIYKEVEKHINSLCSKPEQRVYLFQDKFFDDTGENFFSGGAERYMLDLAELLKAKDLFPILIQRGDRKGKTWYKTKNELHVIGLNLSKDEYILMCSQFNKPKLAIYSGFDVWGDCIYENNILVSHGITWDTPFRDVIPKNILKMYKPFKTLVSVDTNTLSWLRSTFSSTLISEQKNLHFIANYVDTNSFVPLCTKQKNNIKISFPRRCAPERGFWLFAEIAEVIANSYRNVSLEFVGFAHGNDINNELQRLCTKYPEQIKHYVQEASKMHEVYQQADISLIPTLYAEGTSLSCLEAMACGNIVIATNIGGLPNLIIDGYNGFLINPTKEDLLSSLNKVIADNDLRENIAKNAIMVARAFDKKIWIEKWEKVIDEVIK